MLVYLVLRYTTGMTLLKIPTHNFFISSPICVIFSREDMHMTTITKYDIDGKSCSLTVTFVKV